MKNTILTFVLLFCAITGICQRAEFTKFANGLIYDDTTISRLKHIVDSLHIRYRRCDMNRTYYSMPQAKGFYLKMTSGNFKEAYNDIQNNISLEDFYKKYPSAVIDSNQLITISQYKNTISVTPHSTGKRSHGAFHLDTGWVNMQKHSKYGDIGRIGNWVYGYYVNDRNIPYEIMAIYLETPLKTSVLPGRYSTRILYADCMVDTTTNIFTSTASSGRWFEEKHGPKYEELEKLIIKTAGKSPYEYAVMRGGKAVDTFMGYQLSREPQVKKLFNEAVEEALQSEYITSDWFESSTQRYYSKNAALALKRNRRVTGSCSRDERPREHLFEIALLAAETANWQVFLRAHLDIMNDRVDRMSDGSYAWGSRNTYLKELEELDINVHELMLAISIAINNPASNHYFGDVGRLGRAFAEAKDRTKLEQNILEMIADNELDDYNRLRMHYLFLNYVYYLPEKAARQAALQKLENADKNLPAYLYSKMEINKENIIDGPRDK